MKEGGISRKTRQRANVVGVGWREIDDERERNRVGNEIEICVKR